jgi:hypothetical protein
MSRAANFKAGAVATAKPVGSAKAAKAKLKASAQASSRAAPSSPTKKASLRAPSKSGPTPAESFWAAQDLQPCWVVPMAHGVSMPWLRPHERGMLVAIERARSLGRTALLVDPSEDQLVDTYYAYQAVQLIEAKQLVLDEATGAKSHDEIMEGLRVQLVSAMRYGQTLYIRLGDCACDFLHCYTDPAFFPLALFDHAALRSVRAYAGPTADNLWESGHPLAGVLRKEDVLDGVFHMRGAASDQRARAVRAAAAAAAGEEARPSAAAAAAAGEAEREAEGEEGTEKADDGFEVVACTRFDVAEYAALLSESLPLAAMQARATLPTRG